MGDLWKPDHEFKLFLGVNTRDNEDFFYGVGDGREHKQFLETIS